VNLFSPSPSTSPSLSLHGFFLSYLQTSPFWFIAGFSPSPCNITAATHASSSRGLSHRASARARHRAPRHLDAPCRRLPSRATQRLGATVEGLTSAS
jgi:hypothetical protein